MIIVQLSGGFGNQLFQYAAGLSLANHHHVEIKVDVSLLDKNDSITGTIRHVDIDNLALAPKKATPQEIDTFTNLSFGIKYLEKSKPFYKRKVYKERSNKFDINFLKAGNNLYLKGNRQSEKYFINIEDRIKKEFELSETFTNPVKEFGNKLSSQNSIAIHIRRGDYLTAVALEWLGILPLSYYEGAVQIIIEKEKNCKFYIFSDDINWAKQNLKIEQEHEYVSGEISKNAMQDFYLMSKCKHNIIANSTFSWWAAWLNSNKDKIVIAPINWYNQIKYDTTDLIPETWIRI